MIKTRHQLNPLKNESVYRSMILLYKEGGVTRFYRGMTAEVIGIVPKSSGMYGGYEFVKRRLDSYLYPDLDFNGPSSKSVMLPCFSAYVAGFASGIPESLIVTPTQVIKVRLQAKEHLGRYSGPVDCCQQLIKNEGFRAFYIGLTPTLFRNCIWNTVYFGSMFWLKQRMPTPESKVIDVCQTLVSGFVGAVFATCWNAPFDVRMLLR